MPWVIVWGVARVRLGCTYTESAGMGANDIVSCITSVHGWGSGSIPVSGMLAGPAQKTTYT